MTASSAAIAPATTVATATAATIAATAAAIASAAATTTTATRRTCLSRTSFVDRQRTALDGLAIEFSNGSLRIGFRSHRDKGEAT